MIRWLLLIVVGAVLMALSIVGLYALLAFDCRQPKPGSVWVCEP